MELGLLPRKRLKNSMPWPLAWKSFWKMRRSRSPMSFPHGYRDGNLLGQESIRAESWLAKEKLNCMSSVLEPEKDFQNCLMRITILIFIQLKPLRFAIMILLFTFTHIWMRSLIYTSLWLLISFFVPWFLAKRWLVMSHSYRYCLNLFFCIWMLEYIGNSWIKLATSLMTFASSLFILTFGPCLDVLNDG